VPASVENVRVVQWEFIFRSNVRQKVPFSEPKNFSHHQRRIKRILAEIHEPLNGKSC
jgi:hypothetical protein